MKKKLAGLALSGTLLLGAAPFAGTAAATTPDTPTDPVLCFVAAHALISEALEEYRAGYLSARDLRHVLLGTSSFLGDCLTPTA